MDEFTLIGRQLNVVLLHMRNRLDGQGTFINSIKDTIAIAQRLIDEAIVEKTEREEKQRIEREEKERQRKELALMAQAERETRAFLVYEKQMKMLEEAKSAASEKESTAASSSKMSASKQDSSTKKVA